MFCGGGCFDSYLNSALLSVGSMLNLTTKGKAYPYAVYDHEQL